MDATGGNGFPSTRRLAKMAALSERSVCTHLDLAESLGWISRRVRGPEHGQGWRAHVYSPRIPEGTERSSASSKEKALKEVQQLNPEGTEPHAEGTEPDDKKVLKEVQSNTSVNSSKNTSGRKKKKTPFPSNYKVTEQHILYATQKGIPENAIEDLFEGFAIHHRKVGSKFVDWFAAWQTWCRNEIKFHPEQYQADSGPRQRIVKAGDPELIAND
nr:hypothetical protein 15 [Desulfobacteraceae bacterium]